MEPVSDFTKFIDSTAYISSRVFTTGCAHFSASPPPGAGAPAVPQHNEREETVEREAIGLLRTANYCEGTGSMVAADFHRQLCHHPPQDLGRPRDHCYHHLLLQRCLRSNRGPYPSSHLVACTPQAPPVSQCAIPSLTEPRRCMRERDGLDIPCGQHTCCWIRATSDTPSTHDRAARLTTRTVRSSISRVPAKICTREKERRGGGGERKKRGEQMLLLT